MYCLHLSLPSTRWGISVIIVGNNDCYYCYGLCSSSPSTHWDTCGIIVGVNDKSIDRLSTCSPSTCRYNDGIIVGSNAKNINNCHNHKVVILFRFLPSPLYQVSIYINVIAIMHSILDTCLVSRGDIFLSSILSSSLYLLSQTFWIYIGSIYMLLLPSCTTF